MWGCGTSWQVVERHGESQVIADPYFSPASKIKILAGDLEISVVASDVKFLQVFADSVRELRSQVYYRGSVELNDGQRWPADSNSVAFVEVGGFLNGRSGKNNVQVPLASLREFYQAGAKSSSSSESP